jgi:hypothetical protein
LRRLEELRRESGERQITESADLQEAILRFEPLWEQLNTCEKEHFIRTLVASVHYDGRTDNVTLGFHNESVRELCKE